MSIPSVIASSAVGHPRSPLALGLMLGLYGQAATGLLPAGFDALSRRTALGAAAAALTSQGRPAAASRPAQAQPVGASASDQRLLLDGSANIVDSSQEYDTQGSNPRLAVARQACYSHVWASPWTGTTVRAACSTTHAAAASSLPSRGATSVRRCAGGRRSSARRSARRASKLAARWRRARRARRGSSLRRRTISTRCTTVRPQPHLTALPPRANLLPLLVTPRHPLTTPFTTPFTTSSPPVTTLVPLPLTTVMQLEMIKAVDALDERPFAIGLEMFYRRP